MGGGAAPLQGVEQGRRQELIPQPDQVFQRRSTLLGGHDFGQPPAPRLNLQQLLENALAGSGCVVCTSSMPLKRSSFLSPARP